MATRRNDRTITINDNGNSGLKTVDGVIVQPYAQITMVDAEHGDCNVIDLCRARIDGNGQYNLIKESTEIPTYSRSIIDCGPYQKTLDALKAVLTDVGQPKFLAQQGGTASIPAGFDDAKVQQLQFTHIDEDHCGNGPQLIHDIWKSFEENTPLFKSFHKTTVAYHALPPTKIDFTIAAEETLLANRNRTIFPTTVVCKLKPSEDGQVTTASEWLSLIGGPEMFRLQYNFRYQLLEHGGKIDPQQWVRFGGPQKHPHNDIQVKLTKAQCDKYESVAISCKVALEVWDKNGPATMWQPALCLDADDKDDKKKTDVMWRPVVTFDIRPPGQHDGDMIGLVLPNGTPLTKPGLKTPAHYTKIADELGKIWRKTEERNRVVGTVPILFNPTVTRPVQGVELPDLGMGEWRVRFNGPSEPLYQDLIKHTTLARFLRSKTNPKDSSYGPHTDTGVKYNVDGEHIANRASVITYFSTSLKWKQPSQIYDGFHMLFTGDAFDRDCDIQNTIPGFMAPTGQQVKPVALLKVPHHCSEITSDRNFYRNVRARVYLICAKQSKHGNPSLATLRALASTFAQDQASYAASPSPVGLLFFSNPDSLTPVSAVDSNVYHLLNTAPERPWIPKDGTEPNRLVYNYRCFRLRGTKDNSTGAGRIILGRNELGELAVQFTVTEDEENADKNQFDWVEMRGAGSNINPL